MPHFETLQAVPGLRHHISTRTGGLSRGHYAGNNLGFHVGDDPDTVRRNRINLAQHGGYDAHQLVAAQQVHGTRAQRVTAQEAGCGALDWEGALADTDAFFTSEPNLPLLILVADCAPLLLVHPQEHTVGVVHAGWRGALAGIAGGAASVMTTEPAGLLVGLGPCLCVACLEVGEEVAEQVQAVDPMAVIAGYGKPHLDLRGLISRDLVGAGVKPAHIEVLDICPRCQNQEYFSHRGDGGTTGRFGIVAWWQR